MKKKKRRRRKIKKKKKKKEKKEKRKWFNEYYWATPFEFHTPPVEDLRDILHWGSVNFKQISSFGTSK